MKQLFFSKRKFFLFIFVKRGVMKKEKHFSCAKKREKSESRQKHDKNKIFHFISFITSSAIASIWATTVLESLRFAPKKLGFHSKTHKENKVQSKWELL